MNAPALRIALRELRGGLKGFRIFLLCLALGVAAIAGVGSVRMAIQAGLSADGAELLGGDAQLSFTYRFADVEERAWMASVAEQVSEIADFRSLVATTGPEEGRERSLAQVKAVDGAYPLYGQVGLEPAIPLEEALAMRDGLPGLVAERILADRLGVGPGDILRLGVQDFELRAILTREPDPSQAGFGFGPRVIATMEGLAGAELLGEGTLFNSSYRLRLSPDTDLEALRAEARAQFPDSGLRWQDRRNGAPEVAQFVDRLGAFLVLVGLAGLAVGGVGVSAAVRAYLEGKVETIATLKTLGAGAGTIFAIYLIQIGVLGLLGVALGLALGAGVPLLFAPLLASNLPVPADFGIYPAPLIEAALYGLLTALIFTVWPLGRAVDVRAARLFRDVTERGRSLPRLPYLALVALLTGGLVAIAARFSGVPQLALWSAAGIAAALLALAIAA
ncbi:MAG: ABC transporter permease, partial [Rhodobacteraceae bacterium]|nr:ABC transporter permease [Paracoccaceae bacterium]